jgi:hypothetical protein
MGMFDEIKCEYPLPDPEVQDHVFQTKDFENLMERYTITKEGRLIFNQTTDLNFHGILNFYTYTGDLNDTTIDSDYRWYGYNCKFTDGIVVSIERADVD